MQPMDPFLRALLEAKGFAFNDQDDGWSKNGLFLPSVMLTDHPDREFVEKMDYFASYYWKFVTMSGEQGLFLTNDVLAMEFMEVLAMPMEEIKKTVAGVVQYS
jgi:hypothetical protein